uniref:Uncharacterized protein n=1 Tax=Branchiostoma floridae TaxID=7739 RepID=C3YTZ6_BRAFL|eukprot:XP_002600261.1 hypothetical protein BRAFLDRAFT_66768 [Branchiostoma floridae]
MIEPGWSMSQLHAPSGGRHAPDRNSPHRPDKKSQCPSKCKDLVEATCFLGLRGYVRTLAPAQRVDPRSLTCGSGQKAVQTSVPTLHTCRHCGVNNMPNLRPK